MHVVKTWKVSIETMRTGEWKGIFTFQPTRDDLIAALSGDLEDGVREMEQCDDGDADNLEYYQERLRQMLEVVLNVNRNIADTQARKRVLVAGTSVGTIQVTHERVFAK